MHKNPAIRPPTADALKFFEWAYEQGDQMAEDLDYVPMPDKCRHARQEELGTEVKDASGKPLFAATN